MVLRDAVATRALFDRWALTYDDTVQDGPLTGYQQSLAATAAPLALPPAARVLDLGIGTGTFAALLPTPGIQVWGVDVSAGMLARCREMHPQFTLTVGSFYPLPHATGQFDAVISSFAFHEVWPAERAAACVEMARVLRPGGTLCLLDIIFASPAAVAEARLALGELWDDGEAYPLVGELDTLLRAAGFVALRWQQPAPWHWAVTGIQGEPIHG